MQSPQPIEPNQLADSLATFFRQAATSSCTVVAVLDEIPAALEDALVHVACPFLTIYLTRRGAISSTVAEQCRHVTLPNSPLPGRIGGFFVSGQGAIFLLRGQWYRTDTDREILAELTAIGDQALRLTGITGGE